MFGLIYGAFFFLSTEKCDLKELKSRGSEVG